MENLLIDKELELNNIHELFMAQDNAICYCTDNLESTEHLLVLSNYACQRLEKFLNEFHQIHYKYLEVKKQKL